MASAPNNSLPVFYNDLMPLNSRDHGNWRNKKVDKAAWVIGEHAVPLTVDEFPQAQRFFPIVFSVGDNPVPLALMGLNEGVNTFIDENGKFADDVYVPAYIRRYPYLLAKLQRDSENMSLCFDPSAGLLGEFEDGEALFNGEEPTDFTKEVLAFCDRFEQAGHRTQEFIAEITKHDLLMDGEVAIQRQGDSDEQPYIYRGFKMVNMEKFNELRGDVLRGWAQSGLLALLYAHLFSLDLMRVVFFRQAQQGKGPLANGAAAPAEGDQAAAKSKADA